MARCYQEKEARELFTQSAQNNGLEIEDLSQFFMQEIQLAMERCMHATMHAAHTSLKTSVECPKNMFHVALSWFFFIVLNRECHRVQLGFKPCDNTPLECIMQEQEMQI